MAPRANSTQRSPKVLLPSTLRSEQLLQLLQLETGSPALLQQVEARNVGAEILLAKWDEETRLHQQELEMSLA